MKSDKGLKQEYELESALRGVLAIAFTGPGDARNHKSSKKIVRQVSDVSPAGNRSSALKVAAISGFLLHHGSLVDGCNCCGREYSPVLLYPAGSLLKSIGIKGGRTQQATVEDGKAFDKAVAARASEMFGVDPEAFLGWLDTRLEFLSGNTGEHL